MKLIKLIGALTIVAGLIIGGRVFYTIDNPGGHSAQVQSQKKLNQEFKSAQSVPLTEGEPFAFIRIPRLGSDWKFTIIEGNSDAVYASGPGHWPGTAMPGQSGRMAVLGHTVGGGDPFMHLSTLRPGDLIYIDLKNQTFIYVVASNSVIPATDTAILDSDSPGASIVIIGCIWPDPGNNDNRQAVIGYLSK